MSKDLFDGPVVAIEQMLDAREQRSQRQTQLLHRYAPAALVSMTLNTPGPVKYSEHLAQLSRQLAQAVATCLAQEAILYQEEVEAETGMEYYWVVSQAAKALKAQLVDLEVCHPLGRLLDLDVVVLEQGQPHPLSRTQLGLAPRTCFLCQEEAKLCARSRRHTVAEMQATIRQAVATYEATTDALDERKVL